MGLASELDAAEQQLQGMSREEADRALQELPGLLLREPRPARAAAARVYAYLSAYPVVGAGRNRAAAVHQPSQPAATEQGTGTPAVLPMATQPTLPLTLAPPPQPSAMALAPHAPCVGRRGGRAR
jgi:hypothetical protein